MQAQEATIAYDMQSQRVSGLAGELSRATQVIEAMRRRMESGAGLNGADTATGAAAAAASTDVAILTAEIRRQVRVCVRGCVGCGGGGVAPGAGQHTFWGVRRLWWGQQKIKRFVVVVTVEGSSLLLLARVHAVCPAG
eukprot:359935-Chlamydomonas_euryale.AAC.7